MTVTFMEERHVLGLRRLCAGILAAVSVAALAGCNWIMPDPVKTPPPMEYVLMSPYPDAHVIAVAPAINMTGSRDFDTLVVSDTMFNELQQVGGLTVLPVNKTIAAMNALRLRSISTPEDAAAVAAYMHADAILMISVTAYDPYVPPTVGMMVQLYTVKDASDVVSPAAASEPILAHRADGSPIVDAQPAAPPPAPVPAYKKHLAASISAVFNGANQTTRQEIRDYAQGRINYDSALGAERYIYDSDSFMKFVCHAMVHRLMEVERDRVAGR